MKQTDVFGKVLSLTKRIHLQKPPQLARISKFFTGPRNQVGRFGTEWWTTWDTEFTSEDLSIALMQANPALTDGDIKTFSSEIMEVMKEVVEDESLFDFWKILGHQVPTLFDAIIEPDKFLFAKKLYVQFEAACQRAVCEWAVIYPLHRTRAKTIHLGFNGLSLVEANDASFWLKLQKRFPSIAEFDAQSGIWKRKMDEPNVIVERQAPIWLVCEVRGTADGARRQAARHIKNLVALALSIVGEINRNVLMKTMWETSNRAIQFSDSSHKPYVSAGIGHLLPPIGDELEISPSVIDEIRAWHQLSDTSIPEAARRAITASQFLHQALLEKDNEQFLHYFITLDSLFGERWKVESGIIRGVRAVFPKEELWVERCRQLFDLRSELVHGEISSIAEWQNLSRYRRHFRSEPLHDAEIFAMKALRRFFQLPAASPPDFYYEI